MIYMWYGETGRDGTIVVSYKRLWSAQVTTPPWRRTLYYPILHPSYFPPQSFIISISTSQTHVFSICFHSPLSLSFVVNSHVPPSLSPPYYHNSFFPLCTFFSRYWPRPLVPVPGGCPGGWASHSQGCSVHSSHRLPWGLPLSAAVGCLPGMKGGGRKKRCQWKPQHISHSWILNWEAFFPHSTCNVFI